MNFAVVHDDDRTCRKCIGLSRANCVSFANSFRFGRNRAVKYMYLAFADARLQGMQMICLSGVDEGKIWHDDDDDRENPLNPDTR